MDRSSAASELDKGQIDGDSVVKQPVILGDYTSGSNTLVLYGIDEGDEICLAS